MTNYLALGSAFINGYYTDLGIPVALPTGGSSPATDSTTLVTTLYYVLTNSAGVTPISIGTGTIFGSQYLQSTNDTLYAWVDGNTGAIAL